VVELSAKLKPITEKQIRFGREKCHSDYVVRSRRSLFCLECGHTWKEEIKLLTDIDKGCDCPGCGKLLKLSENHNGTIASKTYYGIITTLKDMQVIRIFVFEKHMKKLKTPEYFQREVMQHWIDTKGNVITMSLAVNGLSRYFDEWIRDSELEVKPPPTPGAYRAEKRYDIGPFIFYPERRVLPIIKRNGYKGSFHGLSPQKFFSYILKYQKFETLLKAGQTALLKSFSYHQKNIDLHWDTIRICIRNNYIISNTNDWFDYIHLLYEFGRDLRNPKYVCPDNLKKAHDRYVKKHREVMRRKKLEEIRAMIEDAEPEYMEQKGKFFGIEFSENDITVKVLKSVREFDMESELLGHCVFENKYYKKKDSLVLSAKIEDTSIETIEVSLREMKIIQARGKKNKPTPHHARIVNLVEKNMDLIAKISKN
jgi:hypothetical protein